MHYYPKSMGGSEQNPVVDGSVRTMISRIIDSNCYIPFSTEVKQVESLKRRQKYV